MEAQPLRGAAAAGVAPGPLSGVSGSSNLRMPQIEPRLNDKDKALVRLFMASCFHRWELLEGGRPLCNQQSMHRME